MKNVSELMKFLSKYRDKMEKKEQWVKTRFIEILVEDIKQVPEDVAAVPAEVLERALAYAVLVAKIYRVLEDERWYREFLEVAKKTVRGDKRALKELKEKLQKKLQKVFPVSEEVYPLYIEEYSDVLEKVIEELVKPGIATSLATNSYKYIESIGNNEELYLAIASEISKFKKTYEIVPVREIARIIMLVAKQYESVEKEKHET